MKYTYKFLLGEVVWYHLPRRPNHAVKARITSVSRVGPIGAERYSVQRLDEAGHDQIHGVSVIELSRPQSPALRPATLTEITEPHHV